ncbi:MAG: hypothetical protein H7235_08955 [Bdellovibrionaceae bacterium]|nr:hypothetical protein [Pseudobdellovibrionaceae bacterium]
MSSNVKRILISFLISLLGIAGTYFYFEKINPILQFRHDQKPLAQIENLENISRKKLAEHRTWQVVEFGDSLYSGEMVKTSGDSELQIRFLDTNAILNLEPDSAITIQKTKDRVSISLIEGNLFIENLKSKNGFELEMQTEQGSIRLNQAAAKFTKGLDSKLQFDLLTGNAFRIDENGRRVELKRNDGDFNITLPVNMSTVESNAPEIKIKWISLAEPPAADLIFKIGASRANMQVVSAKTFFKNEVLLPAQFGKNRVEISLRNTDGTFTELSSVRFQLRPSVLAMARPTPKPAVVPVVVTKPTAQIIWVGDNSNLQPFAGHPEISLSWLVKNKESVEKVKIKIVDGDQVVVSKVVSANDTTFKTTVKKPGRYLASIEAFDDSEQSVAKSTLRTIVAEEFPFLPKPEWTKKDAVEKAELNGSYSSSWNEIAGALNYKLVLTDASGRLVKEWVQKRTYFSLKGLLPGQYTLTLAGIDLYQRESPQKAAKTIQVLDNSEILAPKLKRMRFK